MSPEELALIRRAAALIDGRTLIGTWKPFTIDKDPAVALEPGGHCELAVTEPLIVPLNGEDVALGWVEQKALSALVVDSDDSRVRAVPHLNDIAHFDFLPEPTIPPPGKHAVRCRPLPPGGPATSDLVLFDFGSSI